MGVYTYVTLSVLSIFKKDVENIVRNTIYDMEDTLSKDLILSFYFNDVSNGELDFLPELQKLGIAYDSKWEREYDIEEGGEYFRFTSTGESIIKTIYESDKSVSLKYLQDILIKENPLEELEYLVTNTLKDLAVLPWDNQEEYGKLYRVNQLLLPT